MNLPKRIPPLVAALFIGAAAAAQEPASVFDLLDLAHPGLGPVAAALHEGDSLRAKEELLSYYRSRTGTVCPGIDPDKAVLSEEERRWADEGMEHRFFVHTGYQPSFFYGEEIDWQYWPVKDNELRWQLHRTKWWVPMGKAFRATGEEKYAREWRHQYLDWIEKNPLTEYCNTEKDPGEGTIDLMTADNVYFAWRPLEVSDRVEFQIHQFLLFLPSEAFDAGFLEAFLINYDRHCRHLAGNFSARGNHLLFQAQRLLYGAVFFPELKRAAGWREEAIGILNREIEKQVYDDGMQYELDPHYHLEAINIFFNALEMCDANGCRDAFPASYLETVERMIEIHCNYCFPDYTNPMFSDAKLHGKEELLPCYRAWAKVFPGNGMIRRMATEGAEGCVPDHLSRAFRTSGFYVLRNGWDEGSVVMSLKAGPPAFWHCQPDNGTFELWCRGRNFFPDSGSYVYAGDAEINAMREWFRQTCVHNTLTLDGRNLERTDSKCTYWSTEGDTDVLTVENPSYEGLTHRRTVLFVDRRFFVLLDEAFGPAAGEVELHYNLVECDPQEDFRSRSVETRFEDGNNLRLQVFADSGTVMRREQGRVSRTYRHYAERPAYAFVRGKQAGEPVRFITLLLPLEEGAEAPEAQASFDPESRTLRLETGGRRYAFDLNGKN